MYLGQFALNCLMNSMHSVYRYEQQILINIERNTPNFLWKAKKANSIVNIKIKWKESVHSISRPVI